MKNEDQENGVLSGPLILTVPASNLVAVLSLDWLDDTNRAALLIASRASEVRAARCNASAFSDWKYGRASTALVARKSLIPCSIHGIPFFHSWQFGLSFSLEWPEP